MANRNSSNPVDKLLKGGAQAANREASGRYLGELAHRERASDILSPSEVSGEYDAGRLLTTTLGGQIRALTHDDLRTFRDNVKKLGKKFKGGITAKGVIDLSTKADRDRANDEIRTAIPMQSIGGRVHFVTNAGPNSDVTRHHVHIEMLNYNAAISSPGKLPELAKMLTSGPLKFDCDCGRHTFWFRFIATAGNYNAGRPENGFPKIRNPNLIGVACKHVLRVMVQLAMPITRMQVEKMIDRGRNSLDSKVQRLTKKEAEDIAKTQADQSHWKRSQVETAGEKKDRLIRAKSAQITVILAKTKISKKQKQAALSTFKTMVQVNIAKGFFTAKEAADMLSVLK
nr:hypothetical protein [uncultured Rhodoferax sp.]